MLKMLFSQKLKTSLMIKRFLVIGWYTVHIDSGNFHLLRYVRIAAFSSFNSDTLFSSYDLGYDEEI